MITSQVVMGEEALERLREAESILGSEVCRTFLDTQQVGAESRQRWLDSVRIILKKNGIEPENLRGLWHTRR